MKEPTSSWPKTLLLLLAAVAWILFWYWDTARAMVAIWMRSDTYAHAFVVPPITLWLIWRKRHELASLIPAPTLWFIVPLGATAMVWLLGELTAVNALTQLALVVMLILATVSILGLQISHRIAFPLSFLLLSVPLGDFMMPKLMEWTAGFTVLALRATGIPVYQEGLQFVIPSGNWSVVEACSGIRYIIASVTVGTLFAYLNYVTLRRRLIFIAVSFIVPVFANWLRAYMIVMIGHLSGNKLATGVDHLIYGWVFFGIVIMAMFAIGARWSEIPPAETVLDSPPEHLEKKGRSPWLVGIAIAIVAGLGPLLFAAINAADRATPPRIATLAPAAGWQATSAFSSWKPAYANPSAEFRAAYQQDNIPVGVYIAYYRNQDYEHKLITSTNLLTEFNNPVWSTVTQGRSQLAVNNRSLPLITAELLGRENGAETRLALWQWYWINGKLTTSAVEAKLLTALSRLQGKGDDSATIMLYTPSNLGNPPEAALKTFATAHAENIAELLRQTRDKR